MPGYLHLYNLCEVIPHCPNVFINAMCMQLFARWQNYTTATGMAKWTASATVTNGAVSGVAGVSASSSNN